MLLHEPNTALMFSLLLNNFFFSFLHLTHAKLSHLSVFPIWSFLQKPKTNHGRASMTLSSISLSLSLLNHQLSSLKITLFPLTDLNGVEPLRWTSANTTTKPHTPNPLTENHSLPYLILIPLKPQTHSLIYTPNPLTTTKMSF